LANENFEEAILLRDKIKKAEQKLMPVSKVNELLNLYNHFSIDDYRVIFLSRMENSLKTNRNLIGIYKQKFLSQNNLMSDLLELSKLIEEQSKATLFYMTAYLIENSKFNLVENSKLLLARIMEDLNKSVSFLSNVEKENDKVKSGVFGSSEFNVYLQGSQILVEVAKLSLAALETVSSSDFILPTTISELSRVEEEIHKFIISYKEKYNSELKEEKFDYYDDAIYDLILQDKGEESVKKVFCQLSLTFSVEKIVAHGGRYYLLPCINYWENRCNLSA